MAEYLKEKLQEYIGELGFYQTKLMDKRRLCPQMDEQILTMVDKVDL